MQANIDISWLQLATFSALLLIPLCINASLELGINRMHNHLITAYVSTTYFPGLIP